MTKVDKSNEQAPKPVVDWVTYPAGTVHPAETSRAQIGEQYILNQSPVVRVDKWEAPGNSEWNLYSIQVLVLNAYDKSAIQTEMPDEPCPYCVAKKRHTLALCSWFRRAMPEVERFGQQEVLTSAE